MRSKMSKKQKNTDAEMQEQKHEEKLHTDYKEYVQNMEDRIKAGEELKVKPFDDWIRKATRLKDGNEIEITVSGDSGETRHARFIRLKNKRMPQVLKALDGIINLSSPAYESSPEEQTKILNAIRLKLIDVENSFKAQEKKIYDY